jgi:signal transduction histidine kinase
LEVGTNLAESRHGRAVRDEGEAWRGRSRRLHFPDYCRFFPRDRQARGDGAIEVIMIGASGGDSDEAERLKELGHLAAAVGHHVINAFSAVVSNAELIRSHAQSGLRDSQELSALAAAIIENALGASHVPRRLIDFTRRFTSPGFDQKADPVVLIDLNQVLRDTAESQKASDPGVEWMLNLNPIPMIRGSASQIHSLLGYLIQNAREAMPRGRGTIGFSTQVDDRNWVILEVRDTGVGMSPEILKRATEPFFTTKPGRSGIGLTVAHGIWRRHRGALAIESQPGEGTMIRLAVEAHSPGRSSDPTPRADVPTTPKEAPRAASPPVSDSTSGTPRADGV